jgi:hypothetical protein
MPLLVYGPLFGPFSQLCVYDVHQPYNEVVWLAKMWVLFLSPKKPSKTLMRYLL